MPGPVSFRPIHFYSEGTYIDAWYRIIVLPVPRKIVSSAESVGESPPIMGGILPLFDWVGYSSLFLGAQVSSSTSWPGSLCRLKSSVSPARVRKPLYFVRHRYL